MKPSFKIITLLGLAGLILAGCGKSPGAFETRGNKAFQAGAPEAKAAWETAVAALKTNGWVTTLQTLESLANYPNLTPEQNQVVYDARTSINAQLLEAANKGDVNAVEAFKQLRSTVRR